ncbi:MAG: serine/threonine protein kinase [Streptosporangiaceae bacterium]|jgi:hypothetical protein|nr:serine/threonine protein kinase [Streptosporangiaceae bacterium]
MDDGVAHGITTPLQPGDPRRLGPYELLGRLGVGGQGAVFLGRTGNGQQVAIKLLHPELLDNAAARGRFIREAIAAKRVARFCAAQVLDADMAGDRPYIVSEFVPGSSLKDLVAERGPFTGGSLDRLAIGIATALVAIHQAGIVHRDLKPANVLMGPDGPRVIDFGIARALDTTSSTSSRGIGTPGFIAPEQLRGEEAGPPADVFAWGATLAFAATGRSPFGADSVGAVLMRSISEEPDLHGLTGPLRDLVSAAMDKNPEHRPTARGLLLRLLGQDETQVSPSPRAPAEMLAEGATMAARRTPPQGSPVQPYPPVPHPHAQDTTVVPPAGVGGLNTATVPGSGYPPEVSRRGGGRVAALAVVGTVLATVAIVVGAMLVAGHGRPAHQVGNTSGTSAPAAPAGNLTPLGSSTSATPDPGTATSGDHTTQPAQPVTCRNGGRPDSYGRCPSRPSCSAGQIRGSNGQCSPSPCPSGQTRGTDGTCMQPSSCPPGQVHDSNGGCVTPEPQPCPDGQVRDADGHCPTSTHSSRPRPSIIGT